MYWFTISIFAFCAVALTIHLLTPIATNVGLVDVPDNRKKHEGHIPLIGGISIFIVLFFAVSIFVPNSSEVNLFLISCSFMVLIGSLDDYYCLSASARLFAQFLVASIMIFGADIYIRDLGNIIGTQSLPLGLFGIPLTYLAVIGAINAFNMSDGIDGLVGGLGSISTLSLALLFFISQNYVYAAISLIITLALAGFLLFNVKIHKLIPKVFMGDAGSMMLGLAVVWMLVVGSQGEGAAFPPVLALWIIAIPLMDMITIMIRRIKRKRSPFQADREHLHHIFLRAGASSRKALYVICSIALILVGLGFLFYFIYPNEIVMFGTFIGLLYLYFYVISHIWVIIRKFKTRNVKG